MIVYGLESLFAPVIRHTVGGKFGWDRIIDESHSGRYESRRIPRPLE